MGSHGRARARCDTDVRSGMSVQQRHRTPACRDGPSDGGRAMVDLLVTAERRRRDLSRSVSGDLPERFPLIVRLCPTCSPRTTAVPARPTRPADRRLALVPAAARASVPPRRPHRAGSGERLPPQFGHAPPLARVGLPPSAGPGRADRAGALARGRRGLGRPHCAWRGWPGGRPTRLPTTCSAWPCGRSVPGWPAKPRDVQHSLVALLRQDRDFHARVQQARGDTWPPGSRPTSTWSSRLTARRGRAAAAAVIGHDPP